MEKIKKNTKKKREKSIPAGWLTTDDDEINRRRLRAISEPFIIKKTDSDTQRPFGSYSVSADSKGSYAVELRDCKIHVNSCSCPDHSINGLGTCKHIEAVKYFLSKKPNIRKRTLKQGSSRHEIFLDRSSDNTIKMRWASANNSINDQAIKERLSRFFASDGSLIGKPIDSFDKLKDDLSFLNDEALKNISLSQHLISWIEEQRNAQRNIQRKDTFIKDLEAGKRTLDLLKVPLYDYQKEGLLHLTMNGRALLADEMGLGKTIQAIGACMLLKDLHNIKRVLIICPTSLKIEWEEQISKFCDESYTLISGMKDMRIQMYKKDSFFYIANYEQIRNDVEMIQKILQPDVIVLDEAQRIKNWQSKTSQQIKKLYAPYVFVLTGTPIENRIDEIYSIMQVIDPNKLGPLFRFNREYYHLDERGRALGPKNLDKLFYKLRDVILRRNKNEVEEQLPPCITKHYFVQMHEEQRSRYAEHEQIVRRILIRSKERPLTKEEHELLQQRLACMRMLCDTPYILEPDCKVSPKLDELQEVMEELLSASDNKVIIFSEWERMLQLIRELPCFDSIDYAWHTGSVHQNRRREEIMRFKNDPNCRVFLTTDAGATGLNLQAANIVINMDLPWNPAKLQQRIARAWRKHQKRSVQVINFVTENSIEHNMIGTLNYKQALADIVVDGNFAAIEKLEEFKSTKAFTDKLTALLITKPQNDNVEDDVLQLEDDANAIASINPSISTLSIPGENSNKHTLPEVPELTFKTSSTKLEDALDNLDPQVRQTILALMQAGLLAPAIKNDGDLISPEGQKYCDIEWVKEQANETKRIVEQAQRKTKMALLLMQGGFEEEMESPFEEARSLLVEAYGKAIAMAKEMDDSMLANVLSKERQACKKYACTEISLLTDGFNTLNEHLQNIFSIPQTHMLN